MRTQSSLSGVEIAATIESFDEAEWNRCFPGELEDWAYYRATEQAGVEGFQFRYYGLRDEGRLIAAVPGFVTEYRLETTVQGSLKTVLAGLSRMLPRLMILRMASLGSPVAETCHLGFAPEVPLDHRPEVTARLIDAFEHDAALNRRSFLVVKDALTDDPNWQPALTGRYSRMPGLPIAWLPIDFADTAQYLEGLSRATRKDVRRKLKGRSEVRVEFRRDVTDLLPQITALYEQARARSDLQFESLPPAWFTTVLDAAGPRGGCFLYWVGEYLAGFNLVLFDGQRFIDKFVGLDGALGPKHNLYVVSWITNVEFCLERGIPLYQSGQAEYGPKRRLGSRFTSHWIWFRHKNGFANRVLRLASRILRFDRHDAEMAAVLQADAR